MRYVICVFLVVCSLPLHARDGKFYGGLFLGRGAADIDSQFSVNNTRHNSENTSFGGFFGYTFRNRLVVSAAYSISSSDNLFGAFESSSVDLGRVMLGYSIPVFGFANIIPSYGYAKWKLKTKEGLLFNPGQEISKSYDGDDFIWSIGLELPSKKPLRFYASYLKSNFDFGQYQSTQLGMVYYF